MKRIKVLYRKKLNMSAGKLAAQTAHAVLLLAQSEDLNWLLPVIVLGVNETPFNTQKELTGTVVIRDAGLTEVEAGTETVLAFVEKIS